ncbi:hypothetical protein K1T71_013508 [Dendrolimus kikuchii]|uniref:Uncharacterized protein n=1 Tax=Dendrolimus kikuchii TaxID=765133 RepID=A0ACC1CGV5_9NEOP|nr:hypothetical protein K1T71_013508 [Dendrolimus kikuchii]
MTSRRIEEDHVEQLRKLLSDAGLICVRSPPLTPESSTSTGESEEQRPCEEEQPSSPEQRSEPEEEPELPEVTPEEETYIFPTPSLRRILPDNVRKIQEYNHPALIPKIALTAQQNYIDILAELVGCKTYRSSLAEFWFLDTLANLLKRAQEDELDRPTQAVLILWFCEWIKEIQNFDAADRKRMLKRFQDNMLSAAKFIAQREHIPTPAETGVHYKAVDDDTDGIEPTPKSQAQQTESKHVVTYEGFAYECSLRDLTKIIHYIYDLFSSEYQYDLVRSVFTFTPEYTLIDAPYQLQTPKRIYAPLKPKKEKPPKKDAKVSAKGKTKKEVDTEEFLALMELKARERKELEEQEDKDRERWNRRSHILPLHFAADDAFFDKYWPPPPPEPEPAPQPEPRGKGKGKGKK